eukprot:jgi/Mesvir1/11678/Mv00071-RA.1
MDALFKLTQEKQVQDALRHIASARDRLNASLARVDPVTLVILSMLAALVLRYVLEIVAEVRISLQDKGLKCSITDFGVTTARRLPWVKEQIRRECKKMAAKATHKEKDGGTPASECVLPHHGYTHTSVMKKLRDLAATDHKWQGRVSGTVYMGGSETGAQHVKLLHQAYEAFSHTNPLHTDIFKSTSRMEAEVVAMTAAMLGSAAANRETGASICGNMTSGGSESILMAVKATRDYMRETWGITRPEMVIAESAHSAFDKAAEYFGVRIRRTKVAEGSMKADVAAFARAINANTILLVASAPGYPHGVIDPVEELGQLALRKRVCLHVDCCLGGFVLPFAARLPRYSPSLPRFDFSASPGVTSMSVDTHKYGLASKGSSLVLFRHHDLRKAMFVAVSEWTGGLYVSPTLAGSRPGGLVAATWAAMMAMGEDGYMAAAEQVMDCARLIKEGIDVIPELYVVGQPQMTVVAFASRNPSVDIYAVNDRLVERGWVLNTLQRPNAVHIAVTLQHTPDKVADFLHFLKLAVKEVREDPSLATKGMAPVYGMGSAVVDRTAVKDMLLEFMDTQ